MTFTRNQNKIKFIYYKSTSSLTLQFPNSHILNHRIIVASFVKKGSEVDKPSEMMAFSLSISELD